MKTWYSIRLAAEPAPPAQEGAQPAADPAPDTAEIQVCDYIGDWLDQIINDTWGTKSPVTAKQFIEDLAALPESVKAIRVHINSPGGDVFAALAIANALRDQRVTKGRTVETIADGLAASSASLVLMAGSPVRVSDNALVMIHQPWSVAVGSAAEMRKAADTLDQVTDGAIVPTYQWHSKKNAETIRGLMDAETWMDADEAIAAGFADEKVAGLKAAASINPRAAAKLSVPERFAARVAALLRHEETPAPEPASAEPLPSKSIEPAPDESAARPEDVIGICRAAGLDLEFAEGLLRSGAAAPVAQQLVSAEKERRSVEDERQRGIRDLCGRFKLLDLADGLVAGGMPLDAARDHIARVRALTDKVEIDAGLSPDAMTEGRPKKVIDISDVYARLNARR